MLSFNPTNARQNLYKLIKQVNEESKPIEIINTKNDDGAILISKKDWNSIQETLYLQSVGVLDRIKHFEDEETEDLGEINWDTQ
ncbi:MAG TPA: type II toxin-antitoxin system Phd/YefM family antitoxin [Bacilli bacterium]|mgnify:CR=1 FL=1|nr:type II toxin-antitoxin system Phd/YefM family antitoxin [Bacilli bacterium]